MCGFFVAWRDVDLSTYMLVYTRWKRVSKGHSLWLRGQLCFLHPFVLRPSSRRTAMQGEGTPWSKNSKAIRTEVCVCGLDFTFFGSTVIVTYACVRACVFNVICC